MKRPFIRDTANWTGLLAILIATWLAYLPGLSGGFLFDDFINLNALGNSGAIDNWASFWRYVTSGTADPTGRPIALLSFLVDARDWPADPHPFLRTNVIIHLINGVLLFVLLRRLGRALQDQSEAKSALAALLATGLWMLHPLFVSTTLYAVQREAMLPATFVLLGLIAYSRGRITFAESGGSTGTSWMVWGIVLGTALALLCKANGVLLPLLAWVLESTVFRQLPSVAPGASGAKRLARIRFALLAAPSVMILAYLSHFLVSWSSFPSNRPWTIGQRFLTEPRILLDYLQLLIIPRSVSSGLFNDHYQASVGLLQPMSTAIAFVLVAGLLLLSFRARNRFPAMSAASLFFFAGHALESSTVPLELYFEHRNYLPAVLLFWPIARGLCRWKVQAWLRVVVGISLLALVAVTTTQRTQMWGHPDRLANLWATLNPESSRAQASAALSLVESGRSRQAIAVLGPRWRANPDDLQIAASYFVAACSAQTGLSEAEKLSLSRTIERATTHQDLLYRWLGDAIEIAAARECGNLSLDDLEGWVKATGKQPRTRTSALRMRGSLMGRVALYREQPDRALEQFDLHLLANARPETAATQSALLASRGYFSHALAHLDKYEELKSEIPKPGPGMPFVHAMVLDWQGYWPQEMRWLRSNFEEAMQSEAGKDANGD